MHALKCTFNSGRMWIRVDPLRIQMNTLCSNRHAPPQRVALMHPRTSVWVTRRWVCGTKPISGAFTQTSHGAYLCRFTWPSGTIIHVQTWQPTFQPRQLLNQTVPDYAVDIQPHKARAPKEIWTLSPLGGRMMFCSEKYWLNLKKHIWYISYYVVHFIVFWVCIPLFQIYFLIPTWK